MARKLLLSPSKISRIETAQRNISARDVRDLLDLYRVTDPADRDELMRLVEESRQSAWWTQYDLDPSYQRLIGLEGAATTICDYQIGVVPGLLQTPEYGTAVMDAWFDDPQVVKKAVDVRLARQQSLGENTALKFVVDESVLRRPMGGRDTMRGQIRRLIELSTEPRIEFQVVPFEAGSHQGVVGGFIILQFSAATAGPAAGMSDIVYHEGIVAGSFLEQPDEVTAYLEAFRGLQSKALTGPATRSFLETLLRDS